MRPACLRAWHYELQAEAGGQAAPKLSVQAWTRRAAEQRALPEYCRLGTLRPEGAAGGAKEKEERDKEKRAEDQACIAGARSSAKHGVLPWQWAGSPG